MERGGAARLGGVLGAAIVVAYPLLVYHGLTSWSPRVVSLVLLAVLGPLFLFRARRLDRGTVRGLAVVPAVTVLALGAGAALDAAGCVLVVPVAISTVLLIAFGSTLRDGAVPMIERFARLQESDLSPDQRTWCRQWTWIWCGFFVVNGGVAAALALLAPLRWWTVYNGLVAYGLIGLLFATEWLLRRRRFPRAGAPARR